jgi:hypothetical protein
VQVDAIEQWTRNAASVAGDALGRAATRCRRVAEVPAWARIHGGHKLEPRGNFAWRAAREITT